MARALKTAYYWEHHATHPPQILEDSVQVSNTTMITVSLRR